MSTINDGGPAFPHQDWDPAIHAQRREHGMSLRDWFAGQALAGMCADPSRDGTVAVYAAGAYEHADAMLAARERKNV